MLRVAGIPVTYFSFIAAALVLGLSTGVKVPKRDAGLFFLCVSFILYTSFTTFNHGFTILNFTNYLAWPFNFCLFFVAYRYFLAENRKKVDTAIESLFWILVYGCFVGLFRKFNGIALDANFMPIISRNGTVVFMVMVAPLLFYMQENNKIGAGKTIFIWLLFFITLTQIESRSGVIGFVFSTLLYYFRFQLKSWFRFVVVMLIVGVVFSSSIADKVLYRFAKTQKTLTSVLAGRDLDPREADYNRLMLLKSTLAIIDNYFWFGTGLGVDNFRRGHSESVDFFERQSMAHNFYLSYMAELGLVGLTLLLFLFASIYKKLAPLRGPERAFRVSFITIALMMTFNEYILLPELWFFFGMLAGASRSRLGLESDASENGGEGRLRANTPPALA